MVGSQVTLIDQSLGRSKKTWVFGELILVSHHRGLPLQSWLTILRSQFSNLTETQAVANTMMQKSESMMLYRGISVDTENIMIAILRVDYLRHSKVHLHNSNTGGSIFLPSFQFSAENCFVLLV